MIWLDAPADAPRPSYKTFSVCLNCRGWLVDTVYGVQECECPDSEYSPVDEEFPTCCDCGCAFGDDGAWAGHDCNGPRDFDRYEVEPY